MILILNPRLYHKSNTDLNNKRRGAETKLFSESFRLFMIDPWIFSSQGEEDIVMEVYYTVGQEPDIYDSHGLNGQLIKMIPKGGFSFKGSHP